MKTNRFLAATALANCKVGRVTPCAPQVNHAQTVRRGLMLPIAPGSRAALFLIVVTISLLLVLSPASAHAQGGVPLWTNIYGSGAFKAIAVYTIGNVFVTGYPSTSKC